MFEQMTFFDFTIPMVSIEKPIRLISLFSGYDSQAMALRNIGANYEHYKAVEFDKYAILSLNAIHGTNFPTIDIRDVHGKDLEVVDKDKYCYLLFYSFPCTDISVAGRMAGFDEGSGTRSSLLWEVKRILTELQEENSLPQILIMENVTAVHSTDNKPSFRKWLDFLDGLGYSTYVEDLNSADYGVAQHRERTFAVSILGQYNYKFPTQMELTKCIEDYFEDLTEEQALKYVVKSPKAMDLLVKLDGEGSLE